MLALLAVLALLACGHSPEPPEATLADPPVPMDPAKTAAAPFKSDTQIVKDAVHGSSGRMKRCYERRMAEVPGLEGRVEVEWRIVQGEVTEVSIAENTSGDAELARCVAEIIGALEFPGLGEGDVSWPFVFRPTS